MCAGESMAMLVPDTPGELTPETHYRITVAGAESNVASYLSMLGASSAWVSRVGADPFGEYILRELRQRNVNVSSTRIDPDRPTGVAYKDRTENQTRVNYFRAGSAASAMDVDMVQAVHAFAPALLHLSGVTSALSDSCKRFMEEAIRARNPRTLISYDVNWRPVLWKGADHSEVLASAKACDIVFVGLDEADALWNVNTPRAARKLLPEPQTLVVKQGAEGATIFHHDEESFVSALKVDVIEPVGAGDAFAAGFLAGLLSDMPFSRAARLGTVTASSALSVASDIGTLPPREYVEELLHVDDAEWCNRRFTARQG